MAHPNEELARRGYDAFSNGDIDALRPVVADNTIFHEPGRNSVAGDYQGIDQMLGFFGTVAERSGDTFRVTVHDVVANDEHAVGLHLSEGERAGRRLHSQQTLVLHVRMAWSLRPGRTTTTSVQPTSSGRRTRPSAPHPPRLRFAPPLGLGPRGRLLDGQLGQRERLQPLIRNRLTA